MYSKQELDWLGSQTRNSLITMVESQISTEERERLIRNPGSSVDYGFSFPGLNRTKVTCLREVREFYETHGKRAVVADIGAGFGNMTWKFLSAGGQVDAFEIQKPSAEELARRIKGINPYFWGEDAIDDILQVIPENALTTLRNPEFKEKYDFIWVSQVLHFLTPDEVQQLNHIFTEVLKPGGKVFLEANTLNSFRMYDDYSILQTAFENAKQERLAFPGFLAANAASMFCSLSHQLVKMTFISAYNQTDMAKYAIPLETNGYVRERIGPALEKDGNGLAEMKRAMTAYPERYYINEYHQVMNLMDVETADICFSQAGFTCVSYLYNPTTGEELAPDADTAPCYLVVRLQKSPELNPEVAPARTEALPVHSFLNGSPHNKLLLDLDGKCTNLSAKNKENLNNAIQSRNYSLALRKVCSACDLDLIKVLLKYKNSLNIDVNAPSSNKFTAFDWVNTKKGVATLTKERCLSLLIRSGARSGLVENAASMNERVKMV